MLDANVKEKVMRIQLLRASNRLYGKIGEIARREVGGKLIILWAPKKAENLQ